MIDAINDIIGKRPRWGFWKCIDRIRLDGYGFDHKRVHRVYCEMRLNITRRTKKRTLTRPAQPLFYSVKVDYVWTLNFMRDTLYDGRPFRTLNVIDEGNREALRIEVGTSITAARVVRLMNELIECNGKPKAIRLYKGAELMRNTQQSSYQTNIETIGLYCLSSRKNLRQEPKQHTKNLHNLLVALQLAIEFKTNLQVQHDY